MPKVQSNLTLNIAASLLPFLAGFAALRGDAFLFFALFVITAITSLFHQSATIKTAARFSLLGFIFSFIVVYIILINADMG